MHSLAFTGIVRAINVETICTNVATDFAAEDFLPKTDNGCRLTGLNDEGQLWVLVVTKHLDVFGF